MQEIVNGNPALRRTLYTVYAVAGLILGATQVGFSAASSDRALKVREGGASFFHQWGMSPQRAPFIVPTEYRRP